MQIVAIEGEPNAVTVVQRFALVGVAVPVRVAQFPQIRDTRVEHIAAMREHARAGAVGNSIEAIGEHPRRIHTAVAVGVLQKLDALRELRVRLGPRPESAS